MMPHERPVAAEDNEAQVEEGAKLDELVYAYLALTAQDVPEPLPIHADAPSSLGVRDASQLSCAVHDASSAAFRRSRKKNQHAGASGSSISLRD